MTIFSKIATLLLICTSVASQSQDKAQKQEQLGALLESKDFVFIPQSAFPLGMQTVNLSSSNNFVKVHPETMEGSLPYFGRSYSATPYGGEGGGIRFNAAPSDYKMVKNKKNYEITAIVKGEDDSYRLNFNISFDGSATLYLSSNKRSSISYFGNILPPENNKETK